MDEEVRNELMRIEFLCLTRRVSARLTKLARELRNLLCSQADSAERRRHQGLST
jgi:hypothetical protein